MKFAPLLTLFTAAAASALIICSFFGGYSTSTLTNVYMLSFNTSVVASSELNNSTSSRDGSLTFEDGHIVTNGTILRQDNVHLDTTSSKSLNLFEYYAVFPLTYCEGQYLDNDNAALALTYCKKPSISRRFDLISIVEDALEDLLKNLTLRENESDLNWPDGLNNSFSYFKSAQTAMIFLSIAGVAFTFVTTGIALLAICTTYKWINMALFIFSTLACVSLAISAAISTAMINNVTNAFGNSGDEVGISANSGDLYLGLIWTAAAALCVSSLTVIARVCIPEESRASRRRRRPRYGAYSMMPSTHSMMPSMHTMMPTMPTMPTMHNMMPSMPTMMPTMHSMMPMQDAWYHGGSRGGFGRLYDDEDDEDFR